jgi:hypothetical protein
MKRLQARRGNGRFTRNTPENTLGLHMGYRYRKWGNGSTRNSELGATSPELGACLLALVLLGLVIWLSIQRWTGFNLPSVLNVVISHVGQIENEFSIRSVGTPYVAAEGFPVPVSELVAVIDPAHDPRAISGRGDRDFDRLVRAEHGKVWLFVGHDLATSGSDKRDDALQFRLSRTKIENFKDGIAFVVFVDAPAFNRNIWSVQQDQCIAFGGGAVARGVRSLLGFGKASPHVVGLLSHRSVLQVGNNEQTEGEPRHWIDGALDYKLPQIVGGLLMALSAWLAWTASGRIDGSRRGGWLLAGCGLLCWIVGFALIGVR